LSEFVDLIVKHVFENKLSVEQTIDYIFKLKKEIKEIKIN